jgi:hypothetical protein
MYVLKISIYQRLSWLINMLMHADVIMLMYMIVDLNVRDDQR